MRTATNLNAMTTAMRRVTTFPGFKAMVAVKGWTIADLRCENAPPSEEMLELMDMVGLKRWESFVVRLQSQTV